MISISIIDSELRPALRRPPPFPRRKPIRERYVCKHLGEWAVPPSLSLPLSRSLALNQTKTSTQQCLFDV